MDQGHRLAYLTIQGHCCLYQLNLHIHPHSDLRELTLSHFHGIWCGLCILNCIFRQEFHLVLNLKNIFCNLFLEYRGLEPLQLYLLILDLVTPLPFFQLKDIYFHQGLRLCLLLNLANKYLLLYRY